MEIILPSGLSSQKLLSSLSTYVKAKISWHLSGLKSSFFGLTTWKYLLLNS